jgi:hypothetical protein
MGERGRHLAAERFSWPTIAAQTRVVYECAIAAARATAAVRPMAGAPTRLVTRR